MVPSVAELIAYIAVEGVQQFHASLRAAGDAVNSVADTIKAGLDLIGQGLQKMFEFTSDAIQEASKVEQLRLSFTALTGSAEGASYMIDQLRQYALHGVGEFDNLTQAAVRLYSAGLNPLRFIKMVDIMGMILNPNSPAQGSFQVADALARGVSGGNFGRAMMIFRKLGIGIQDMINEGLTVTGNNQIIEKYSGQFVEALESAFKKKHLDKLGTLLEGSMSVAFSNLHDAWLYLLDSYGKAWFPFIKNVVESLSTFLRFLAQSGEINRFGQALASAMQTLFGNLGGNNAVVNFLSYLMAALNLLPSIVVQVGNVAIQMGRQLFQLFDTAFTAFVNNVFKAVSEFQTTIKQLSLTILRAHNDFAMGPIGRFMGVRPDYEGVDRIAAWDTSARQFTGIGDVLKQALDAAGKASGLPALMDIPNRIQLDHNRILSDYERFQKNPPSGFEDHSKDPLFNDLHAEANEANKQTASNTARIAASMEHFKRFVLGGGDRGKNAVSVSEMYGRATPGGHRIQVDVRSGNEHLDRYLGAVIENYHQSFRRSALGGGVRN